MSKMLSSWKEIAHFFGKGVRTVQRWEKTLDLPIHRPPGAPSNVVLARTTDLEEWMHRGQSTRAVVEEVEPVDSAGLTRVMVSLEREVSLLSQTMGVQAGNADAASPVERLAAFTETLAQVNDRLSSSRTAKAA